MAVTNINFVDLGNLYSDTNYLSSPLLLQVLDDDEVATFLNFKERVTAWMAAVKKFTTPHFDDVHKIIYRVVARRSQEMQVVKAGTRGDVNREGSKPAVSKL